MFSIFGLIVFMCVCFIAAATSALFPPGDWYERLAKPSWQPPNWVFAPVWTGIYLTIALSGWLVWRKYGLVDVAWPLAIYVLQLVLNAAWTPIFFGLRRPGLAFVEIVMLWMAIVATMAIFYPIHLGAAVVLLPYLAWVTFAAALNLSIWRLNRSRTSPTAACSKA